MAPHYSYLVGQWPTLPTQFLHLCQWVICLFPQDVHPTFFFAVPRVWEKFKDALETELAKATGLKATIINASRVS